MKQRVIMPSSSLIVESDEVSHKLPTDRPVVQYIRRSTGKQVKESVQSKIQQDEATERKLRSKGFTDIRKIALDDGKSGQKRVDERPGMKELYRMIRHRELGAIACYDASRLWRDTTHVWYNDFIQLIQKYRVPVIMYAQTYWPDSRNDMDKLREEFAHAAHQLRHFTDKVNPARLQAIELGQNYGGHAVPIGFIVVGTKGEKHYVVYEPHARLVRWLFLRFRELGGNLPLLGKELRNSGFKFPPFDASISPVPHIALFSDGTGYTPKTRTALVSILTNPAYIGWYTYAVYEDSEKELKRKRDEDGNPIIRTVREVVRTWVNKEAHEPIVPMEDFLYAYTRLSDTTLEGEPNESKPKVDRRYGVRTNALLEGILESNGQTVYVSRTRDTEVYRITDNDTWEPTSILVHVSDIDSAFSQALIQLLATLELRYQQGLKDSIYDQLNTLQKEKQEEINSTASQLANIVKAIRQAELDKRVALEEEYEPGVRETTRLLKRLHADSAALEATAQQASSEETELAECQDLFECALQRWDSLPFERQKRFVRLVVARANMEEVAPHLIRLTVTLKAPINCTLVGHMYRVQGSKPGWTEDEDEVLRKMYPREDREAILHALPNRTWGSISQRVGEIGVQRQTSKNTSKIPIHLTYSDVALMKKIGMGCTDKPHWTETGVETGCIMNWYEKDTTC